MPEKFVVIIAKLEIPESDGVARFRGNASVPAQYENGVPLFKANSSVLPDGQAEPGQWWLDDGTKEWRVGNLGPEHFNIPSCTLWSLSALRREIDQASNATAQPTPSEVESAREDLSSGTKGDRRAKFYFYFDSREDAVNAASAIKGKKPFFEMTVRSDKEDSKTALIGSAILNEGWTEIEALELFFEQIAIDFRGEYDGNQLPL